MIRRQMLSSATFLAASVAGRAAAQPVAQTFVLVAGAFSGGWLWGRVADRLRSAGHKVFTPSLTGLGDRAHLISRNITMDTFVQDIVAVIETEELSNVILVGSSFGGVPVAGAAARVPGRLRHVVYLDSIVVEPGKSAFDGLPSEVVAQRRRAAQDSSGGVSLPVPPPAALAALGIITPADVEWCTRQFTPHPIGTYETPLNIASPTVNGPPRTYIACLTPDFTAIRPSRAAVRSQPGWRLIEMATGHLPMVTAPDDLVDVLRKIAA